MHTFLKKRIAKCGSYDCHYLQQNQPTLFVFSGCFKRHFLQKRNRHFIHGRLWRSLSDRRILPGGGRDSGGFGNRHC